MKRKSNIPEEKLLPYDTICAATRGDPDAMAEVLRHFDGYISLRATRIFYDEYGQSYRGVDAELKQRIQDKLTARIMERFRPDKKIPDIPGRVYGVPPSARPGHITRHNPNYVAKPARHPCNRAGGCNIIDASAENLNAT